MTDICWVTGKAETGVRSQTNEIKNGFEGNLEVVVGDELKIQRKEKFIADTNGILHPVKSLKEAIFELNPDIVVLHTLNPKVREYLQDIQPHFITVARLGVNLREQSMLDNFVGDIPDLLNVLHTVDHIVASSHRAYNEARSQGILDNRLTTIPSGISVENCREPTDNKDDTVGMIGRMSYVKNQIVAVEGVVASKRMNGEINPNIKLAGEINHRIAQIYKNILTNNGSTVPVEHMGYVDNPVINFFQELDLHCHPSWTENCPQTLLESAVAGVPSIISESSWSNVYPEADFPACYPDDPWEWAEMINSLLSDNERRKEIAMQQQSAIVENYNIELITSRYEELFNRLLDDLYSYKIPVDVRV